MAFVRERKQLPHGDLDRAERRRIVLRANSKGLAQETLLNPVKFVYFVRGVSRHVSVDAGLTENKLRKGAFVAAQL